MPTEREARAAITVRSCWQVERARPSSMHIFLSVCMPGWGGGGYRILLCAYFIHGVQDFYLFVYFSYLEKC